MVDEKDDEFTKAVKETLDSIGQIRATFLGSRKDRYDMSETEENVDAHLSGAYEALNEAWCEYDEIPETPGEGD